MDIEGDLIHYVDQGVTIQGKLAARCSPLPSMQLCTLFERLDLETSFDGDPAPARLVSEYYGKALPRLQAILPSSEIPYDSQIISVAHCRSVLLKLFIYAVTNNLAGMDGTEAMLSRHLILQHLEGLSMQLFRAYHDDHMRRALFREIPSLRPMAETLFRAAVETDNSIVVRQLLAWPESGLEVNDVVIVEGSRKFTAIEFAAWLQHLSSVKVLMESGADLTKFYKQSEFGRLRGSCVGALYWALYPKIARGGTGEEDRGLYDDALVSYLVEQGAQVWPNPACYSFKQMTLPGHERTAATLINRSINPLNQVQWLKSGFFHLAFANLEENMLSSVLERMHSLKCDLDYSMVSKNTSDESQWTNPFLHSEMDDTFLSTRRPFQDHGKLAHIVDICASRGHVSLLFRLLELGASLTPCTMTAALAAEQLEVAYHLVSRSSLDFHQYSEEVKSTSFAEMILLQDRTLISTFSPAPNSIPDERSYVAALRAAASAGDSETMQDLLQQDRGTFTNARVGTSVALAEACYENHAEVAALLLNAGASPSHCLSTSPYHEGHTCDRSPLASAVKNNNADLAVMLLDHGADESTVQKYAMEYAVAAGNHFLLDVLISAGVDPDSRALELAIEHSHEQIVRAILTATEKTYGLSYCLEKAVQQQNSRLVKLLLAHGAVPTFESLPKNEIILQALVNRSLELCVAGLAIDMSYIITRLVYNRQIPPVRLFLSELTRQLASRPLCWLEQPLLAAIWLEGNDGLTLSKVLLDAGANANALFSSTKCSSMYSYERHCQRFERYGLVPEELITRYVTTAFLEAIFSKNVDIVRVLIESGADVNLPAKLGCTRTPLQQASESGSLPIVRLLISHGADVGASPAVRYGATALQIAAIKGFIGIAELLIENGADICAPAAPVEGRTAIEGAAEWGRFDMVKYLASQAEIPRDQLSKAKDRAQENGHGAVVDAIASMLLAREMEPALPLLEEPVPDSEDIAGHAYSAFAPHIEEFENVEDVQTTLFGTTGGFDLGPQDARTSLPDELADTGLSPIRAIGNVDEVDQWLPVNTVDPNSNIQTNDAATAATRYACQYCHKQLSNASALKRHIRTHHTSVADLHMYSCDICNKRFARKDMRDRHRSKHNKDDHAYAACSECGHRHRKDWLRKHEEACRRRAALYWNFGDADFGA